MALDLLLLFSTPISHSCWATGAAAAVRAPKRRSHGGFSNTLGSGPRHVDHVRRHTRLPAATGPRRVHRHAAPRGGGDAPASLWAGAGWHLVAGVWLPPPLRVDAAGRPAEGPGARAPAWDRGVFGGSCLEVFHHGRTPDARRQPAVRVPRLLPGAADAGRPATAVISSGPYPVPPLPGRIPRGTRYRHGVRARPRQHAAGL